MASIHYLLDVYGVLEHLLDNENFLRDLLENSAIACGAEVLDTTSHKFQPQGVTALCLLSESHISVHTWPEKGEAAFDIFTCGNAEPKIAVDIILEQLCPAHKNITCVQRL
jgi:S-adenosylmethionine decarboxylase